MTSSRTTFKSTMLLACFDFDHTLFEYQPPRHQVFATILQELGFSIDKNRIEIEEFLLRTKPLIETSTNLDTLVCPRSNSRDVRTSCLGLSRFRTI